MFRPALGRDSPGGAGPATDRPGRGRIHRPTHLERSRVRDRGLGPRGPPPFVGRPGQALRQRPADPAHSPPERAGRAAGAHRRRVGRDRRRACARATGCVRRLRQRHRPGGGRPRPAHPPGRDRGGPGPVLPHPRPHGVELPPPGRTGQRAAGAGGRRRAGGPGRLTVEAIDPCVGYRIEIQTAPSRTPRATPPSHSQLTPAGIYRATCKSDGRPRANAPGLPGRAPGAGGLAAGLWRATSGVARSSATTR